MEEAGQRLKRVRERLKLRYRDVEEFSQKIAERHKNDEFAIALSRLADIENKGTVPSLYRLYSLCVIYGLSVSEVLNWYGVDLTQLPQDSTLMGMAGSRPIGFSSDGDGEVQFPLAVDPALDFRRNNYLSRAVQRWGRIPLLMLGAMDIKSQRYAWVGSEDWSMYPLLMPGSFVLIDEGRRKIIEDGWATEFERPVYFLGLRDGYLFGWVAPGPSDGIIVQFHPSSKQPARVLPANEYDIIGQVTGVASRWDRKRRPFS